MSTGQAKHTLVSSPKTMTIVLLSIFLVQAQSIAFDLVPGQELCMSIQGGGNYDLSYVVSGDESELVLFVIRQGGNQIFRNENQNQFQKGIALPSGEVQLCFSTGDNQEKSVDFVFFEEKDPLHEVIDKKDIATVRESLYRSITDLLEIAKNQQFHIERDESHKRVLEKSEKRIKWAGVFKIAVLLASALVQLWIMKGFFKNASPYQPVNM